ncbi:dTMP kinase [Neomicrococcus lactis]|uniref:Thymidylate kinase n=1 Tax=Neomicrococcus lactis TaxID=732241 RepID=A0A7W8YBG0_9MICC|nr:dTMP kinase [Neomicrococcus lactis]
MHHGESVSTPTPIHARSGLFIVFEGGDGAGKSTQAALLASRLERADRHVLRTREPGGTVVGEKLRGLILDHGNGTVDARTEALMFAASRAAHVEQVLLPALNEGTDVICDRYIDSSVAYQGVGRGLGTDKVLALNTWATSGLVPDLTVLLDIDPVAGRARRLRDNATEDRLESEPDEFHASIRAAFRALADASPERYLVLNALDDSVALEKQIYARVKKLLETHPGHAANQHPNGSA